MIRPALLAALLALAGSAAWAQNQPFSLVGSWHRDAARSMSPPGEPPPKSSVMNVTTDDGRSFAWSVTTVGPDNSTEVVSYRGAFDGKPYPLQGGGGGTMAVTRQSPTAFSDSGSDAQGAQWSESCTVAADQRTMTCEGTESPPKGVNAQPIHYRDVWVR